jgi:hypothetical protein
VTISPGRSGRRFAQREHALGGIAGRAATSCSSARPSGETRKAAVPRFTNPCYPHSAPGAGLKLQTEFSLRLHIRGNADEGLVLRQAAASESSWRPPTLWVRPRP